MEWIYNDDGTVADRSAIEYLLGGGFLYTCEAGIYCTLDSEVVSAALVHRLIDSGHVSQGEEPIQLTDKGRRELRVPPL